MVAENQKISIKLDEQEFKHVFKEYYAILCSFANLYVEDRDAAADIVQDVFTKLWQIRNDFFYIHQVKAFLYTAVRNKALNELEHSRVVTDYAKVVTEKMHDSVFHDLVIEKETYRILTNAIDKLPDQTRAIMRLALAGKNNNEIAEQLQISHNTVHMLKKIAYKKLRVYLKDYYYLLYIFML